MSGEIRWLLPQGGGRYKANLHCHTTLSDGAWTPARVKREYAARGYAVVAYTDHNIYRFHRELCDDTFLALGAVEVNLDPPKSDNRAWDNTTVYHLNFYDPTPEAPRGAFPLPPQGAYGTRAANAYIAQMRALGFLCCYNHPWWSLQTYDDYKGLEGLCAFEIYNHGCEQEGLYGYAPQAYDELLRGGWRLACLATDDNHNLLPTEHPLCDAFGGFTIICAEALTSAAVLKAVENRQVYASCGPLLHALYVRGGVLTVECSPCAKIYVRGAGRGTHCAAAIGEPLTRAEFTLTGHERYVRVELRDENGRFACSSAYFADELFAQTSQ